MQVGVQAVTTVASCSAVHTPLLVWGAKWLVVKVLSRGISLLVGQGTVLFGVLQVARGGLYDAWLSHSGRFELCTTKQHST